MRADLSIYLVTDAEQCRKAGRSVLETVQQAVAGGATAVQVRAKEAPARETVELVCALDAVLPSRIALIVNDRVDVYCAALKKTAPQAAPGSVSLGGNGYAPAQGQERVTGVHLGQNDVKVEAARYILGAKPLIGLSAATQDQLEEAVRSQARIDYVGIGALRETKTKMDAPAPLGLSRISQLASQVSLPAVAIGGITPEDMPGLRAGGLAGGAVVSWICASADPEEAARELAQAWRKDQRSFKEAQA